MHTLFYFCWWALSSDVTVTKSSLGAFLNVHELQQSLGSAQHCSHIVSNTIQQLSFAELTTTLKKFQIQYVCLIPSNNLITMTIWLPCDNIKCIFERLACHIATYDSTAAPKSHISHPAPEMYFHILWTQWSSTTVCITSAFTRSCLWEHWTPIVHLWHYNLRHETSLVFKDQRILHVFYWSLNIRKQILVGCFRQRDCDMLQIQPKVIIANSYSTQIYLLHIWYWLKAYICYTLMSVRDN